MRRKRNPISRARRISTGILFVIFVVMPIIWFYSVRSDYYTKVEQKETSNAIIQPIPASESK
jgi:hypothetical protein